MHAILQEIQAAILAGDAAAVRERVQAALAAGCAAAEILDRALVPAMAEVGRRFECEEYFVPEMLVCARAMQEGLALLRPQLVQGQVRSAGSVVAGSVQGDLHEIGKNLVCTLLEGAGFEVQDLGTDVAPEKFVAAAKAGAGVIGLSALLTTTMPNMSTTIRALQNAGLSEQVKIMVGGAPVTEQYAREIGAHGYAPDASRAAVLAKSLVLR
jgi:5-methyltetrahydrofolate--homocysteine methyltransferase